MPSASCTRLGIEPVVVMNRTNSGYPWDAAGTGAGWADRWEYWQHFYAQTFYLAQPLRRAPLPDVQRAEPGDDISSAEYLERLRFASDAVQSAVADVNALFGKSLDPQMQAPGHRGRHRSLTTVGGSP